MRFTMLSTLVASTLLAATAPAFADPVAGGDPTGAYRGDWQDVAAGQNFLVQFTLDQATTLSAMDIFAVTGFWQLGDAALIKIRSDVNGDPAATNLYSLTESVDALSGFGSNSDRVTVDFSGVTLAAGTYWIGLSSLDGIKVWNSYDGGQGSIVPTQRQLQGDSGNYAPSIYNLGYVLYGTPVGVPEPAAWGMLIGGFGLAGAAMRRRRANLALA